MAEPVLIRGAGAIGGRRGGYHGRFRQLRRGLARTGTDPVRQAWRFVALAREVMAVAAARRIRPRGFNGYDPEAFAPDVPVAHARESIAALARFNRGSGKTHSGIWRDLAVRRRPTELDVQVGIAAGLAREAGLPAPGLTALTELIHDVETGRRERSLDTFQELTRRCI